MKARVTVYLWAKKGSQWVQVNKIPTKKNPVTVYAGEAAANEPQDQYPVVATNLLGITDKLM